MTRHYSVPATTPAERAALEAAVKKAAPLHVRHPWIAPEPVLCPSCGSPAVRERTLAHLPVDFPWRPHFDAEGRRHTHDPNVPPIVYFDAKGHEWFPSSCWCGWRGYESEQAP